MTYKFEQLEIWQRALDYADRIHDLAERLPKHERYNLREDRGRRLADRRQGTAPPVDDDCLTTGWRRVDRAGYGRREWFISGPRSADCRPPSLANEACSLKPPKIVQTRSCGLQVRKP